MKGLAKKFAQVARGLQSRIQGIERMNSEQGTGGQVVTEHCL
jgi:hypothetical protein